MLYIDVYQVFYTGFKLQAVKIIYIYLCIYKNYESEKIDIYVETTLISISLQTCINHSLNKNIIPMTGCNTCHQINLICPSDAFLHIRVALLMSIQL